MHSQPVAPRYDPAEIRSATAIVLPTLPDDWTVTDVQIFPSTFGPSVEMTIRAGSIGTVSLFAARPGTFDVVPATLSQQDDLSAAHWQIGEVAYALVTRGGTDELNRAAERLVDTLY
jgi:anti-sigma factor RsiW